MRRFLGFLLAGAGLLTATAVSTAASSHQSTITNPALVAAGKTCESKGLAPGSDAFKACVQNIVNTNTTPASTNSEAEAAGKTCKDKGLKPGSDAFKACVKTIVQPGSKLEAAQHACKAQGL